MKTTLKRRKFDNNIEHTYQALIENIQDYAIFMLDTKGNIKSWDKGAQKLFGYSKKDIIGKNFSILFTSKDNNKKAPADDLKNAKKNERFPDEREYKRKNGSIFWSTGVLTSTIDKNNHHQGYSKIMRDMSDQKELQNTILHRSTHDYLTGLPNRGFFEEFLIKTLRNNKEKCYSALFFMDFNNFKIINDKEGHRVGDLILIEIAHRLTKGVRKSDCVARLGGDEFVILLRDVRDIKDVEKFAKKILKIFKPKIIVDNKKKVLQTSVSIGIALYPSDGKKPAVLLHNADMALYQSKKKGGNQYNFYNDIKFLKKDMTGK